MEYLDAETVLYFDKKTLKYTENIIKNDAFKKFRSYLPNTWPPNVEDPRDDEIKPPDCVTFFLKSILKLSPYCTPNVNRIVDYMSQDITFNILGQKTTLLKLFWGDWDCTI